MKLKTLTKRQNETFTDRNQIFFLSGRSLKRVAWCARGHLHLASSDGADFSNRQPPVFVGYPARLVRILTLGPLQG